MSMFFLGNTGSFQGYSVLPRSAGKIASGADYPRPSLMIEASYKQQLEFITVECDFLSEEQRQQILGGTALQVYKWDAAD